MLNLQPKTEIYDIVLLLNLCISEILFLPKLGLSDIWVSTLVTLTIYFGQSNGGIHEMKSVIRMVLVCVSGVLS